MPAVDGEQAAARDGDSCRYAEVGERVGGDVGDGRVGGKLEHHDDVLLHLILEHQRALGKETLVETDRERKKEGGRDGNGRGRGERGRSGDGGGEGGGDRTDGAEGGKDKGGEVH